jgi:hypothetical protein
MLKKFSQSSMKFHPHIKVAISNRTIRFCRYCRKNISFWALVGLFTMVEPLLCANTFTSTMKIVQLSVLGISTVLFIIQLTGFATSKWVQKVADDIGAGRRKSIFISAKQLSEGFSYYKLCMILLNEEEYVLEFLMLTIGWVFLIMDKPGIAALRCYRVFRILW